MQCENCGGKVDKITENNYFCRQCGARQTPRDPQYRAQLQKPGGLLNLVIILNYVTMVLFGLFLFLIYYFSPISYFIVLLISAGILFWVNGELKKLDPNRRKFTIIANVLIMIFFFEGFGISLWIPAYLIAVAILQYYVLYMHQPTVELYRQN